jgi:prephenate dehydrogenase
MPFDRIAILGVGLLGGSLGMAIKAAFEECEVVGFGHRQSTLDRALEIGAIERGTGKLAEAVRDCGLIVLCTPVGLFERLLTEMAPALAAGAIVTDVGSTKRSVVRMAEKTLPASVHFVGSHPMAGSEKRGVEYARADLFDQALCITTPTGKTDPAALAAVEDLWQAVRMRVVRLSPEDHDRFLADVSHLPHALAASLVTMQEAAALPLSGKGFLDTTRIAGGDGELWRDILLDNRDNLRAALDRLKLTLAQLERMLEAGDGQLLAAWLNNAARRREEVLKQKLRDVMPD